MADNKCTQRLSISNIFRNLLSCSEEESILEKTVHVYDPKELQTGWQSVSCNAKYVACPTGEKRAEQASPASTKSDASKKRNKKAKGKEIQENSCNYDKVKSLGVLSYGVPSWRTIIDPENCEYVQRTHPCSYFTAAGHWASDLRGLSFIDPAGVFDQHLGGFVQRQRTRDAFQRGHSDGTYVQNDVFKDAEVNNVRYYNQFQLPLNDLKPIIEEKADFWPSNTFNTPRHHALKPLPASSTKVNLQTSSVTITTKNLPAVLLPKCSTIDRKTGRVHRDILHGQKIKLAPFKQPYTPVSFVQPNRKQKQKLNWLPIATTSPRLPRNTGHSDARKPTWSKPMVWSHDPITNNANYLKEQMEIKQ